MKIILKLFVFILLINTIVFTQIQDWNWTKSAGGGYRDYGNALTLDPNGNIYLTGEFIITATFPPSVTLNTTGGAANVDYFLVKYDSVGNAIWGKRGGGTLTDRGYGVVLDQSGNIYTTGHYFGPATFDTSVVAGAGNLDCMTIKYDSSGNMLWLRTGKSVSQLSAKSMAIDNNANTYVIGYFGSTTAPTAYFDTVNLTSHGQRDNFLVKYNTIGEIQWGVAMGGTATGEEGRDVAVDNAGNVYVTGIFKDTAYFGSTVIYGNGGLDAYFAKYNTNGVLQWVKKIGSPLNDEGQGIALDNLGNILVAGRADSLCDFGAGQVPSLGKQDAFIAKYDNNGNYIWAHNGGSTLNDYSYDVAVDRENNLVLIGTFQSSANFGGTVLTSAGADDIFVIKLDPAGNINWVKQAGGTGIDRATTVAYDYGGNVYFTGFYKLTSTFGPTNLTSLGADDIFLSKIGNQTVPVELTSFTAAVTENNISLNWRTATETNNRGFQILRSNDKKSFEKVAFIEGKGTTTEAQAYQYIDKNMLPGTYYYSLSQVDNNGLTNAGKVIEVIVGIPNRYSLEQNYPNPFNPTTNIRFNLPKESNVVLTIYNSIGQTVKEIKSTFSAGTHLYEFNAANLGTGLYIYKIKAVGIDGKEFMSSRKMMLIK